MKTTLRIAFPIVALGLLGFASATRSTADQNKPVDAAVARTQKQVRMLDDLYKTAIVLITDKYVQRETDLPAGTAFQALFGAMKKKGWHEVRLVDASGDPLVESNAPADDFEKAAVAALRAGKAGYEQVIEKEGKRFLRSATPVPVVMKKCTLCHSNYEGVPEGEPIGALSYMVPVE